MFATLVVFISSLVSLIDGAALLPQPLCTPFHTTFTAGSVSSSSGSDGYTPFVSVTPRDSYQLLDGGGLGLILRRPEGVIKTVKGINDRVGDGATVNSTFEFL